METETTVTEQIEAIEETIVHIEEFLHEITARIRLIQMLGGEGKRAEVSFDE